MENKRQEEHGGTWYKLIYQETATSKADKEVFPQGTVSTGIVTTGSRQRAESTLGVPPLLQEEDLALG